MFAHQNDFRRAPAKRQPSIGCLLEYTLCRRRSQKARWLTQSCLLLLLLLLPPDRKSRWRVKCAHVSVHLVSFLVRCVSQRCPSKQWLVSARARWLACGADYERAFALWLLCLRSHHTARARRGRANELADVHLALHFDQARHLLRVRAARLACVRESTNLRASYARARARATIAEFAH